jgi:translation initiation factor 5
MTLNVNRSDDAFYRYKMPKILTKIEGKGNGIKTVIVNMSEIAKAINRKPSYPTKFFGVECGAQTQMDEKNDRYIVNGVHEPSKLQELMYNFIQKYVLCSSCGNPETVLSVKNKKSGIVGYRCKACGHNGEVISSHRLTQYIVKNPPDPDIETHASNGAAAAAAEGGSDENDDNAETGNGDHDNEDGQNGLIVVDAPPECNVDDSAVVWSADVSQIAMAQRIQELPAAAQRLTLATEERDDWLIQTEGERGDTLLHLVKSVKEKTGRGNPLSAEDIKLLKDKKDLLQLKESVVLCFVEGLLENPDTLVADIALYRKMFLPLTRTEKAQRYMIGGIELLVSAHKDKLLPLTPKILHALYENDLLNEKDILAWYNKGATKRFVDKKLSSQILQKAKPFIDWLNEAEEESSEGEEAENAAANEALGTSNGQAAATLNKDDDDDSDIDIDNL